jgi:hypothetical protein
MKERVITLLIVVVHLVGASIVSLTTMMSALSPTVDIEQFSQLLSYEMLTSYSRINHSFYEVSMESVVVMAPEVENFRVGRRGRLLDTNNDNAENSHLQTLSAIQKNFSCVSFPAEYSPLSFCSGVVDYAFILNSGDSMDTLEQMVRTEALFMNPFMDVMCLSDYKRLICANIYLKCVDNGKDNLCF